MSVKKPLNYSNDLVEEKFYKYVKLRTLFGRLKNTSFAAFDARTVVTDPKEKLLLTEIDETLENFVSRLEEIVK